MFKKDKFKWDELLLKHSKKLVLIKWKFKEVFDEIEDHIFDEIEMFSTTNSNVKINFDKISNLVLSKINNQNTEEKNAYDIFYNENCRFGYQGELSVGKIFEIRCLIRENNWFISNNVIEEVKIAILFYFEIQCVLETTVPGLFKLSERYANLAQLNGISLLSAILLSKGCII
jgi:hypothetical protein